MHRRVFIVKASVGAAAVAAFPSIVLADNLITNPKRWEDLAGNKFLISEGEKTREVILLGVEYDSPNREKNFTVVFRDRSATERAKQLRSGTYKFSNNLTGKFEMFLTTSIEPDRLYAPFNLI